MLELPRPTCRQPELLAQQQMILGTMLFLPPDSQGYFGQQVAAFREALKTNEGVASMAIAFVALEMQELSGQG